MSTSIYFRGGHPELVSGSHHFVQGKPLNINEMLKQVQHDEYMRKVKILTHLRKDKKLVKLIDKLDFPTWEEDGDLFSHIVSNIIGQQLSGGPARIIEERFVNLFTTKPFPTPEEILAIADEKIRSCGTSWAKVKYIKSLAQAVFDKSLDLESLRKLTDEEIIQELTKVKGIGRWTAEMILIFHLQRPDVFSLGDLGLRNAVSKLYRVPREDLKKIEKISLKWKPYRSYAARYLWDGLDEKIIV